MDGRQRLAHELRELSVLCLTSDAPDAVLEEAARRVAPVRERLSQHRARTYAQRYAEAGMAQADQSVLAERSALSGTAHPLRAITRWAVEDNKYIAHANFGPLFEGAPGRVHGGLLAAAFDHVLGYAQSIRRAPSVTASLEVTYRVPTPLQTDLRFEVWLERVAGRKHFLAGHVLLGEQVTASVKSVFVALDHELVRSMFLPGGT